MFEVRKAKRSRRPLKINLEGLSGSGKTFTLIRLAMAMMRAGIGKRFVIADSENESAGLYAGIEIDGQKWEYETCSIPPDMQNPRGYTEAYKYLVSQGYDIIGMDSMTHAWHGAMEQVDAMAKRNRGDKFAAWAEVTPAQREMLSTLTDSRAHLISTMRVKSDYERVEENGRTKIKKVGMKTDQREGAEYEFDVVARLDGGHECFIEKVRGCTAMDGKSCVKPGPEFWKPLFDWWLSATDEPKLRTDDAEIQAIRRCATLGELQTQWGKLTKEQQARLCPIKDAKKLDLMKPKEEVSADDYPGDPDPETDSIPMSSWRGSSSAENMKH